ncbi:class I SAM-dependent methyltransferase [SAR86 cluster bacterium]|nr:class I SAM-dependent methyltransferase [SAR86 cluster bacterium]
MKNFNITNPVFSDLENVKAINPNTIKLLHDKTRDGSFNVLIDESSGVIFLEKFNIIEDHYIESPGAAGFDSYFNQNGYFEDDLRRFEYLKGFIKNSEYILDVGSEWGGFLNLAKEASKKIEGAELNLAAVKYVENNLGVKVHKDVKFVEDKPDILTMFHVLEHIPNQIDFLKILHDKMCPGAMLVIEVPHANDFLIKNVNLPEFRDFTFWNEHLVLHTEDSLEKIISASGFKNIDISFIQRYGFQNHFGWLNDRKPGGHIKYASRYDSDLNKSYCNWHEKNKTSDTLFAIAYKKSN